MHAGLSWYVVSIEKQCRNVMLDLVGSFHRKTVQPCKSKCSNIIRNPIMHCCFSLVISILISFQLVFMMLTIFSSILVIVRERFLKIVLF